MVFEMLCSLREGQGSCRCCRSRQANLGDSWTVPGSLKVASPVAEAHPTVGKLGVRAKFPGILPLAALQVGEILAYARISLRLARSDSARGIFALNPGEATDAEKTMPAMQARLIGLAEADSYSHSRISYKDSRQPESSPVKSRDGGRSGAVTTSVEMLSRFSATARPTRAWPRRRRAASRRN